MSSIASRCRTGNDAHALFVVGLAKLASECRTVDVPPLLRELILHAVAKSPLLYDVPEHRRLIGVLLDELSRCRQRH